MTKKNMGNNLRNPPVYDRWHNFVINCENYR